MNTRRTLHRFPLPSPRRLLPPVLLGLAVVLAVTRPGRAQDPPPGPPVPLAGPPAVTLDLQQCIRLALERQPRVNAQRASQAAAQAGHQGLESIRVPPLLVPELPIRRKQSALGLTAAAAAVDQAEHESTYAVTRTYFAVLYARAQQEVARSVVQRLTAVQETAARQLKGGARNVAAADVNRATAYLHLAKAKQIQATQGVQRALAALREAVALEPGTCLDIPPGRLPEPEVKLCLADVVNWALARRGELIRATVFADVACLEVEAQATKPHPKMETFAAGTDIHAQPVPAGVHNDEYRPGGVAPEMPTLLVGPRADRVQRARALHGRARAMVEATRNLITLEAEDAFFRWQEASGQVPEARVAAENGDALANGLDRDFRAGLNVPVADVINARVLAAQAHSQFNEYLYHEVLALADLERITAGGFCPGLVPAPPAAPPSSEPAPKKGREEGSPFGG
jgi:outer membrane protein TolC